MLIGNLLLKDTLLENGKIGSLSTRPHDSWKVGGGFVVHKTFLELHIVAGISYKTLPSTSLFRRMMRECFVDYNIHRTFHGKETAFLIFG